MDPTRSSKSVHHFHNNVGLVVGVHTVVFCGLLKEHYLSRSVQYACNKMPDYGRLGYLRDINNAPNKQLINRRTFRITMMHTIPIRLKHTTRLEMKIVITETSWSVSRHKIHRICQDHSAGAQENE